MTTPTQIDVDRLRALAGQISTAATWAASGAHTRRIQAMSDELLEIIGEPREAELGAAPNPPGLPTGSPGDVKPPTPGVLAGERTKT